MHDLIGQNLAQERQTLRAQLQAIDERCRAEWASIVAEINRERDRVCIPLMLFNVAAGAVCLDRYNAVRDRRRDALLQRCAAEKRAAVRAYETSEAVRLERVRQALRVRPTDLPERALPIPDPRTPFEPGDFTRVGQAPPAGTVTADYWFLTGIPTTPLTREPAPLRPGEAPIQRLGPRTRVVVLRLGCPYSFVQTDTPECLATGVCLRGWVPTENIGHVYQVARGPERPRFQPGSERAAFQPGMIPSRVR